MTNLDSILEANADYVDSLYQRYLTDPGSVGADWARFFAVLEQPGDGNGHFVAHEHPHGEHAPSAPTVGTFDLIHSYRELGHLIANLDPLGHNQTTHPLLELDEFGFTDADLDRVVECPTLKGCDRAPVRELIRLLRATYCRTLGAEYMFIENKDQRTWLQERMEPTLNQPVLSADDRKHILQRLVAADGFEQFLHTKYVGQKRFSLEGGEALIPMLDALIEDAGGVGVQELVMGMPHRGRLNVLAHTLRKPYEMILAEFEGTFLPSHVQGDGDVKYHLGYARDYTTRDGHRIHVSLLSNPSHLEAIDPIAEGIVRAKQQYLGDTVRAQVLPVLIHGDAAFIGQGLVSETLTLSELDGYCTGGTVHIIVNNQIGFTTTPKEYRISRYASDVAKMIQAPVFHVNGDDPEAAVQAARLAFGFRHTFKQDVIIDLICYRKYGHNETDDPTFTQPVMYQEIGAHQTVPEIYAERLINDGVISADEVVKINADVREILDDALNYARDFMPRQQVFALGGAWKGMQWAGTDWNADTAVAPEVLPRVIDGVRRLPEGFATHPRVDKLLEQRAEMVEPDGKIDWGCAEMLAFGSLLLEGTNVRLSGQDSGRGTFSHRHAILYDTKTNAPYVPLNHLTADQGHFEVLNSMLSEAAVLGFEYGFSSADPRNLVVWEAQFGDFANGAQVMIDQFIASAESKWQRMSGLVLLLPHGYEGQGPEHSSARLERYLQLCAEDNMQVVNLTTPAQYFHALRRQMHRSFRKPLVVMSPKSLLRNRLAVSSPGDLLSGRFEVVLGEADAIDPAGVRRVLLCSGKVYYTLLTTRRERDIRDIAIIRVEQLYPFPAKEIEAALQTYSNTSELLWVQEEPWNMGAWHEMARRLRRVIGNRELGYAGRAAAASPAVGSYKVHQAKEAELINYALRRANVR